MANQSESETGSNGEALSDTVREAYTSAREGAKAMGDTAAEEAQRLEEEAEAQWEEGKASLEEMLTKAEFAIIDHPLAAVGAAFAAGWVVGKLFR